MEIEQSTGDANRTRQLLDKLGLEYHSVKAVPTFEDPIVTEWNKSIQQVVRSVWSDREPWSDEEIDDRLHLILRKFGKDIWTGDGMRLRFPRDEDE